MRQNLDAVSIGVICRQRHGGVTQQGMLLFEIALTGFLEGRMSGENLRHAHSHLHSEKKIISVESIKTSILSSFTAKILPSRLFH